MDKEKLIRHKKLVAFLSVFVFITFTAISFWYIGRPMLRLVSEPETFRLWIDSKGVGGRLIFIGMVALQVIFAIIPGEPLEIGAGYAFGAIEGTLLCIAGFLLGSIIIYTFVKKWGIHFVELFFSLEKINNLRFLNNSKKLNVLAFLLFMIPGTPKDIMIYFLGLTNIKPLAFILTVTVARLPSLVTSTIGGNALGMKKYAFAIIVFTLTLAISAAGFILYNVISKHNSKKS